MVDGPDECVDAKGDVDARVDAPPRPLLLLLRPHRQLQYSEWTMELEEAPAKECSHKASLALTSGVKADIFERGREVFFRKERGFV